MSTQHNMNSENVKRENEKKCVGKTPKEKNKIFSLLEEERVLVIKPKLAAMIGLNESIILQQIKYWLQRSKHIMEGRVWFYKTNKEWKEELPFFSESTIRRTIESLQDQELILTRNSDTEFSRTKYYTLNDQLTNTSMVKIPIVQNDAPIVQNEHSHLIHILPIENNNRDLDTYGYTQEQAPSPQPPVVVSCESEITKLLNNVGIGKMDVPYWVNRWGETKICEKLSFMPDKTKITSSQAAWLREALERDYQPPKNATMVKNGGSNDEQERRYMQTIKQAEEAAEKRRLEYLALFEAERAASVVSETPKAPSLPSLKEVREKTLSAQENRMLAEREKARMKQAQETPKTFFDPTFAGVLCGTTETLEGALA